MEGKKYKSNAALQFLKKNIYLILMVVCILAIGTLITLTALNKTNSITRCRYTAAGRRP